MFRFQSNHRNFWNQDQLAAARRNWMANANQILPEARPQNFHLNSQHLGNQPNDAESVSSPSPNPCINVKLCDEELWKRFRDVGTEMVLTKPGRLLFPAFRVQFSGLEPHSHYIVMMDIVRVDNHRYRFRNGKWLVCGRGETPYDQERFVHPMSPATGQKFNASIVSFHRVKLSNANYSGNGKFLLRSMHLYQIRVHVGRSDSPERLYSFNFPQTTFVTVTVYQNTRLSQLKIASNPFAKGLRPDGEKRKKQISSYSNNLPGSAQSIQKRYCQENSLATSKQLYPKWRQEPFSTELSFSEPRCFSHSSKTNQNVYNYAAFPPPSVALENSDDSFRSRFVPNNIVPAQSSVTWNNSNACYPQKFASNTVAFPSPFKNFQGFQIPIV